MSNEGIFDKVKDFLTGHPEQAGQGLDRAEHLVNERTGGTYSQQVTQGGDMVRQQLGVDDGPPDGQPGATLPTPGTDPDVVPTPTPGVPPAPNTPEPTTVPTPAEPGTQPPPAVSPDPVPTTVPQSAPESIPEATPDTNEANRT